jgi:hypothetical protein
MRPNEQFNRLVIILRNIALKFSKYGEPESPPNILSTDINPFTERFNLVVFTLSQLLISAFFLHTILLNYILLSTRRMKEIELTDKSGIWDYRPFLNNFAITAEAAIDNNY